MELETMWWREKEDKYIKNIECEGTSNGYNWSTQAKLKQA